MNRLLAASLVSVALVVWAISTSSAESTGWKEYIDADGGFAVSFPEQPDIKSEGTSRVASVGRDFHGLGVEVLDRSATDNRSAQQYLTDWVRYLSTKSGMVLKIVSETPISLGNYPGIEMEATSTYFLPALHRVRLYVVGRKAYRIYSYTLDGSFDPETDRFFQSFRLVGSSRQP